MGDEGQGRTGVLIMKRTFTLALAAAATFAAASPAQAALTPTNPVNNCATTNVSPTASACVGWYAGNLLSGNVNNRNDAKAALALLGFNWSPNTLVNTLQTVTPPVGSPAGSINFTGFLSGLTVIGIHRGGGGDNTGSSTAFFRWNNLAPTDVVTLNLNGLSTSTLYITTFSQVPEPGTWMLMIAGIGLMGWQLRRRRQTVKVSYA
jgi:hypothetical protein